MTETKLPQRTEMNKYYAMWGLLQRARRIAYRLREKNLIPLGITPEQAGMLWTIKANEPLSPSEISRVFIREPHTISVNLQRMNKKGFVKMEQNPEWKNRLLVSLTPKGDELLKKSQEGDFFKSLYECFNDEEFLKLEELLNKFYAFNMKKVYPDFE